MKTLNISISEVEYNKFGLKNKNFSFSDFVDIISREIAKQRLEKTIEIAGKHGLSKMTMEEITEEVKAIRKHAKTRA